MVYLSKHIWKVVFGAGLIFFGFSLLTPSCSPVRKTPEFDLSATPKNEGQKAPSTMSQSLEKIAPQDSDIGKNVLDMHFILTALKFEKDNDYLNATSSWFNDLKNAKGPYFGKEALTGWIKAYTKNLGKKVDLKVMSRLVLAETQNGKISPYMIDQGITSEERVDQLLLSTIPEWIIPESIPKVVHESLGISPPAKSKIPQNDPLLLKAAKNYLSNINQAAWDQWKKSLPKGVQKYFTALTSQLSGKSGDALVEFQDTYKDLSKGKLYHNLALESASRITTIYRNSSNRLQTAEAYNQLMRAWELQDISAKSMDMSNENFTLRKIDEALGAARYRALVGDYENAKIYAQAALKIISTTFSKGKGTISQFYRSKLSQFKADAYHTLAYRIALEKDEFEQAVSLNTLGLQIPNLNQEWMDRLQWYSGFYEYLNNNYASATRHWEKLLQSTSDIDMEARLYYWLAKTHLQGKQTEQAREYAKKLVSKFPLSFYSVVAIDTLNLGDLGTSNWKNIVKDISKLEQNLKTDRDFDVGKIRSDPKLGRLLERSEIFVLAGLDRYAKMAVKEFHDEFAGSIPVAGHEEAYSYLVRLHFAAKDYLQCISLIHELSNLFPKFWSAWPESILIYFPEPYYDFYRQRSLEGSLDVETLLAVSRQESAFQSDARSSANALGLMQLLPSTALSLFSGEVTGNMETKLLDPDFNISAGSRYLKNLSIKYKGFKPAIFSAYNAGEFAVDAWLARRQHIDPIQWVEIIPFVETREYVKNVWRNEIIYQKIETDRLRKIAAN